MHACMLARGGQMALDRLGGPEMADAKKAMVTLFQQHVKSRPPREWPIKFRESAKVAYNLKYMFREDMGMVTERFTQALDVGQHVNADVDGRGLFHSLLEFALGMYSGIVNTEQLKNTNFVEHPEKLVELVKSSCEGSKEPWIRFIGELTWQWMQLNIDQKQMPLTPHHTQVVTMLMFARFFETRFWSKPGAAPPKNPNVRALLMQMKTGEGKSIVIAMLAIFCVKQLKRTPIRAPVLPPPPATSPTHHSHLPSPPSHLPHTSQPSPPSPD